MAQPSYTESARPGGPSAGRVMGCFLLVCSVTWPRIVILTFWIFGSTLGKAFGSWVVPVLGFLFLPWTTMWYALMWGVSTDGVHGGEWLVVAIGVLLDVWTYVGFGRLRS